MPRHPLNLGSTSLQAPAPPPVPPFWTPVTAGGLAWQAVSGGQMPRFEHVWPQESGGDQQFVKITDPPIGTP